MISIDTGLRQIVWFMEGMCVVCLRETLNAGLIFFRSQSWKYAVCIKITMDPIFHTA